MLTALPSTRTRPIPGCAEVQSPLVEVLLEEDEPEPDERENTASGTLRRVDRPARRWARRSADYAGDRPAHWPSHGCARSNSCREHPSLSADRRPERSLERPEAMITASTIRRARGAVPSLRAYWPSVEAEQPKNPAPSTRRTWQERIAEHQLRLTERIRAERELHSSVDVTLTGIERDSDVGGGIMAGALAYRLFIWMLPFALVLVGVLGVVSEVTGEVPREAVAGTGLAGLVTKSVATAASGSNYWWALAVGLPVLVYVTRSLLRALIVGAPSRLDRAARAPSRSRRGPPRCSSSSSSWRSSSSCL